MPSAGTVASSLHLINFFPRDLVSRFVHQVETGRFPDNFSCGVRWPSRHLLAFFLSPGANYSQIVHNAIAGENFVPCAKGNRIHGHAEGRVIFLFSAQPFVNPVFV
jgi:hypothetical protein